MASGRLPGFFPLKHLCAHLHLGQLCQHNKTIQLCTNNNSGPTLAKNQFVHAVYFVCTKVHCAQWCNVLQFSAVTKRDCSLMRQSVICLQCNFQCNSSVQCCGAQCSGHGTGLLSPKQSGMDRPSASACFKSKAKQDTQTKTKKTNDPTNVDDAKLPSEEWYLTNCH